MSFSGLGWSQPFDLLEYFRTEYPPKWTPARVCYISHKAFHLIRPDGEFSAVVSGRLRFETKDGGLWPVVGDWVAALPRDDGSWTIQSVVPRANALYRGLMERGEPNQMMAANVDVALILSGLDNDLNLRRVERYVHLAKTNRIRPVIVLNKLDLNPDTEAVKTALAAFECEVHFVSALTGEGVDELAAAIGRGQTAVLLGSSGVGKSTLFNRILGREAQRTSAVRESDSKGRHTTTHRQLIPMPQGWVLIDMPGIREVGLPSAPEESTGATFPDIQTWGIECRFPDCRHESEPDCRVQQAVKLGELDAARLANFHKMRREVARQLSLGDKQAEVELKARWKVIHKAQKEIYKKPKYSKE